MPCMISAMRCETPRPDLTWERSCWHVVRVMSITIQLDLPDALAAKARAKGMLNPAKVCRLIERELELEEPLHAYREMVDRMRAFPDDEPMTMDEIQAEVNAVRAERRQRLKSGR